MCMYIYIYTHMYIYIYVCMHACVHPYVFTFGCSLVFLRFCDFLAIADGVFSCLGF